MVGGLLLGARAPLDQVVIEAAAGRIPNEMVPAGAQRHVVYGR
jgi:hypothetical protein